MKSPRKAKSLFAGFLAVGFLSLGGLPAGLSAPDADVISPSASRKIVVFRADTTDADRDAALRGIVASRVKRLRLALEADVVQGLDARAAARLALNPSVLRIDDDVVVQALSHNTIVAQAETLPWGVDRVDAELVWPGGNTANPIKVGIIDTGISLNHPDLALNIKGGINTIRPTRSANDDNGHGSHVAGIVAAVRNNGQGVIGVAPEADLYAIKALNRNGSGFLSDIIEGIDWAIANKLQIINMSLGTSANIQSFHDAVVRARNAGIVTVAAAGNSGGAVIFPAAYPEVIAVSATDSNDVLASFSSRGPEVDLAAPGVSIFSTYKDNSYATLSGTSMAAPHVAGVAALLLNTPVGASDLNANAKWDPDEVQAKLQNTASDLGTPGFDNLYGWGLVQADSAVQ